VKDGLDENQRGSDLRLKSRKHGANGIPRKQRRSQSPSLQADPTQEDQEPGREVQTC